MGPGVGRIDFNQLAGHGFDGRCAVLAQPLVPELVQGEVVWEPGANLLEVTERGRAPFGRRQQLRDRAVRVECQRLAFKYLSPQFERPTRFATQRG